MKPKSTFFILTAAILFLLFACSTEQAAVKNNPQAVAQAIPTQVALAESQNPTGSSGYLIEPGDQMDIKFFYNPELNETVTVRPDGKIAVQLVDEVQAAGLTPSQLDEVLTQEYARELKKPMVNAILRSFTPQRVYEGGEVSRHGFTDLSAGMTALQAVISV